ncbi:LysR family transcriptional regulator [uncultured Pigmentiphaga sp.]|uniref:LysR family transcriptional regulator n=1 Tax=uncultured Pigmentiphaga sp. TaxID=340361 RepID=UPI0026206231|nr:LysR family transcriptional regulator [uncultured Pigmentiphaga sp.]
MQILRREGGSDKLQNGVNSQKTLMNVSTKQLRAFIYAAQLGSFTRAAERLHMTQAGLSAIIRELELQMDCQLFHRTTRLIALTEAGQRLLPVAERAVADLQRVMAEVNELEAQTRNTLRVGATPLVANDLLPPAYVEFRRSYPNVKLEIFGVSPQIIEESVSAGELDFGLGVFPRPIAGLERSRLFSARLFCVGPDSSRVASSRGRRQLRPLGSMSWEGLRGKPLICLPPGNAMQQLIDRYLPRETPSLWHAARVPSTERRVGVNGSLIWQEGKGAAEGVIVNHIETQIAMVELGLGWAVVPAFALPACRHYCLSLFELEPAVDIDFYRIVRKGRKTHEVRDEFCKVLVTNLKRLLHY